MVASAWQQRIRAPVNCFIEQGLNAKSCHNKKIKFNKSQPRWATDVVKQNVNFVSSHCQNIRIGRRKHDLVQTTFVFFTRLQHLNKWKKISRISLLYIRIKRDNSPLHLVSKMRNIPSPQAVAMIFPFVSGWTAKLRTSEGWENERSIFRLNGWHKNVL